MSATPARETALRLVREQRQRNAYMRDLLRRDAAVEKLGGRDRAFVQRLCLGVVGTRGAIDEVLARYTKKLEPKLRDAMRISVWELVYGGTEPHVGVSQGVDLAANVAPRARGLANAVLRKIAENEAVEYAALRERATAGEELAEADLACAYGLPEWLVERVRAERGYAAARDFAMAMAQPAPVWVRENGLPTPNPVVILSGAAEGREAEGSLTARMRAIGLDPVPALPGAYVVTDPSILQSDAVRNSELIVADLSAQNVAHLIAPEPGSTLLEIGQGRGTKTLLLQNEALAKGGMCEIVGVDSIRYKTEVARKRLEPYCGKSITCITFDGTQLDSKALPPELDREFDTVFLDAPCSGTGTLRRHPEIVWSLQPESLDPSNPDSLTALQQALLQAAATRVKPGGILAYATCSVLRAENEAQAEAFLSSEIGSQFTMKGETFSSNPAPGEPDGHFCAMFERV